MIIRKIKIYKYLNDSLRKIILDLSNLNIVGDILLFFDVTINSLGFMLTNSLSTVST